MAFPSYTTNGVNAAIDSTPSPFVTLISSNGQEFHIRRSAALVSGTIRRMLDPKSHFREAQTGICKFENISGDVLAKVCEYLYYNEKHKDSTGVPDMPDLPSELCLELLVAADYLDA